MFIIISILGELVQGYIYHLSLMIISRICLVFSTFYISRKRNMIYFLLELRFKFLESKLCQAGFNI